MIKEHSTSTEHTGHATDATPSAIAVRMKDHASMAVVLAGASIAWFGGGHQGQIIEWWLRAGMALSAVALIIAIIAVRRIPAAPTLATNPRARKVYWTAVGAEIALIVLGAMVLSATGNQNFLSTWTLFIVGVHFLPFVGPFAAPILRYAAVGCVAVAALALAAGLGGWAPAPTIAGLGGGVVLLGFAIVLIAGVSGRADRTNHPG